MSHKSIVRLTFECFADLLRKSGGVPSDFVIEDVVSESRLSRISTDVVLIKGRSASFEPVLEGNHIPTVDFTKQETK